jgi:hypothetical protein
MAARAIPELRMASALPIFRIMTSLQVMVISAII